ncbi:putative rna 3'-terminal phosphate cyclase-like protein [Quercus suber]|uniref:Rna 3'-terminal phosphate cyclase-like protein n=1 Tax=Quercus suber TaxID=58331 RepID=A0AAW0JXZ5_QUESU
MGKLQYKKMKGSSNLRQRLVLATLSSTPLLIEDIRAEHTLPVPSSLTMVFMTLQISESTD